MNLDTADLEGLVKAHVLPGLAAVGRLVHAVAVGHGVARVVLAGADPDDVAIRRRHADVADGHGRFMIELMLEGDAVIHGLDQSAGGRGDPVSCRIRLEHGDGRDAAGHVGGADRAPRQRLDPRVGNSGVGGRQRRRVTAGLEFLQLFVKRLDLLLELGDLLRLVGLFRALARGGRETEAQAGSQTYGDRQSPKR